MSETDKIIGIGPFVLELRRRREPIKEWADFATARDNFVATLLDAARASWLGKALYWLAERLEQKR